MTNTGRPGCDAAHLYLLMHITCFLAATAFAYSLQAATDLGDGNVQGTVGGVLGNPGYYQDPGVSMSKFMGFSRDTFLYK